MPHKSVKFYLDALDVKLELTGQEAYLECVKYLTRMHSLYVSMQSEHEWHDLVKSIRKALSRHRPLLEMLTKMEERIQRGETEPEA